MKIPSPQKETNDPTRVLRQKRFADTKRKLGMKKYSFWLDEPSAIVVRSVATLHNTDGAATEEGVRFGEMVESIATAFNCERTEVVRMAVARMYASLNPLNNEFGYPSDEARAGMAEADIGGAVISSKTLADFID